MTAFVIRRILLMLVQLVVVVTGIFVLLRILPTDPVAAMTGDLATPEQRANAEAELGLDQSIPAQLWDYLSGIPRGDLGTSWATNEPVSGLLTSRFPLTFQVVVLSLTLALVLAIILGRAAASRPGSRFDRAVLNYTLFASAQPAFFWALVAIFIFFTKLSIAPAPLGVFSIDTVPPEPVTQFVLIDTLLAGDVAAFRDALAHMAIPILLLAVLLAGPLMKMTRQGVISSGRSEYMLYAKISGLAPRTSRSYMLRNALAPVVTLTGVLLSGALSGIVLLESIFAFPGIALFTLESTKRLDFPAMQGCVLFLTAFALLVYLAMDLIYAALDPRVAYGKAEQ